MAGTSDVLAACAGKRKGRKGSKKVSEFDNFLGSLVRFCYRATNALPRAPLTRPAALAAVAAALDAAALAAPGAFLAVATVPPLGSGNSASKANAAVRDLNRGIRCVASARPRVSLLDVHAALSAAMTAANAGDGGAGGDNNCDSEEEEEEEDIAFSVGPSCLASVLLRALFRVSWDTAARWKAYPAAAAAAATGLPQRLLLWGSSLFLSLPWRKSPSAASSAPTEQKKKRRKAKKSFFPSSNSLLHDGVHFGETAAACVLALALPWARRAARGGAGGRVGAAPASASAAGAPARNSNAGPASAASATGLATALSLASSPPSPSRRRGAVVAASTSKAVKIGNGSSGNGGGKGVSGALASAISLFASGR